MIRDAEPIRPASQAELRGMAAYYITDIAVDITTWVFPYGGAGVLLQPNILEGLLREMNAVTRHILTSDSADENQGKLRLVLPGVNPMG